MSEKALEILNDFSNLSQRDENFERFIAQTAAIDAVCGLIAEGVDLHDIAAKLEVSYGKLSNWLNRDAERRKRYELARQDAQGWLTDRIMKELKVVGFFDIREIYDESGNLKLPSEWSDKAAASIASVKVKELFDSEGVKEGEMKEVKLVDKLKAIELMGKNLRMFADKVEHEHSMKLEDIIAASWKVEDAEVIE